MTGVGVLVCGDAGVAVTLGAGVPVVTIPGLCGDPQAAASAARALGLDRIALALCDGGPSSRLREALRAAGVDPFGVQTVVLGKRAAAESSALVAAALARLGEIPAPDPVLRRRAEPRITRRALLSLRRTAEPMPVAMLAEDACAGSRHCGLCAERCPAGAIDVGGGVPRIDPAQCTACGACVGSCPQGALRLSGTSLAGVEAQLRELLAHGVDRIMLACRKTTAVPPPGWATVELPALGMISAGWVLGLRGRGATVALAPCNGPCCASAGAVRDLADELMPAACTAPRMPLGSLRLSEPHATADAVRAPAGDDGDAAPVRLAGRVESPASPLGELTMAPAGCTLCGACATACPTGALHMSEGELATALVHDPAACVGCARCVAACPEDVLSVAAAIDVPRLRRGSVELVTASRDNCARCAAQLAPRPLRRRLATLLGVTDADESLCPACARREAVDRRTDRCQ